MSKERWDHSFSNEEFVYGEEANEFIQEKSALIPAESKVACFAEGEGRNAVFLAQAGHEVRAYDQSLVGLKKAKQLAAKNRVSIHTEEKDLAKDLVTAHAYDAAIMVFGHVPKEDQSSLIENLMNSVKPGGHVIFEVYSEAQLDYKTGGPRKAELLYDPVDVLSMIEPYTCKHFYYGEVERNEGPRHNGEGHVIQVVLQV